MDVPRPPPTSRAGATALACLLIAGALAVVLAGVPSSLFDLDRHAVPKELALHLTALLGLPLVAWSLPAIRLTVPAWLLTAWLGWSALSAIFAVNYWLAWRALGIGFSGAVVFWMARRAQLGGRGRWVLEGVGVAVVVAAVTGLAQAHGLEFELLAEARAPGGTLGNRNFLAHLSVIGLPAVILLLARARSRVGALVSFAGLLCLVALVVLTRSRAAWLGGSLSLATMGLALLVARRGDRPMGLGGRVRLAMVGLASGIAVALLVPNQLAWRSDSPYRDTLEGLVSYQEGSGRGRVIQYQNSLELVRRSPVFGTGPGNWPVLYPTVTSPGDPSFAGAAPIPTNPWPSSDWIALLAERGPLGALLLLLAGIALGIGALRRLRSPDPDAALDGVALLGVLVATVVCGAFDAVMLLAPPTFIVMALAGTLTPASGPVVERTLPRGAAVLLLPLLVGLATAFAGRSAAQLAAIRMAGSGRSLTAVRQASLIDPGNFRLQLIQATRLRCTQARPHAHQALRLFPHHPSARRAAARCGGGATV